MIGQGLAAARCSATIKMMRVPTSTLIVAGQHVA
jgi:hypothetical protein